MKLRHQEIYINPDNPFQECRLERKQYADNLTELVTAFTDGFVLAVNNKWGTGKTTFIRMWKRQLELSGFKTLYFNAWENDFEANPLSAILAELKSLLPEDNKDQFRPLIEKGTIIAKNLIPSIAKAIVGNYIGIKGLDDVADSALRGGAEILEEEVENYTKRQKGLKDFQEELGNYLSKISINKPLIFIVDELDRCRPSYAVEVLENIKHFFSVKGVVFVLSIDKEQLSNSVKGVYGTEHINTEEYLRRFIDLEFSIPEPTTKTFVKYLYDYYEFALFLHQQRRIQSQLLRGEPLAFIDFSVMFFEGHNLTLRQQEKLLSHTRISLIAFGIDSPVLPQAFILLTYVFQYKKEIFYSIKNRKYNLNEFSKVIENIFPINLSNENIELSLLTQSVLLYLYNNYYKEIHYYSQLIDSNNELKVEIGWKLPDAIRKVRNTVEFCDREYFNRRIDYLLKKIELLENIKF